MRIARYLISGRPTLAVDGGEGFVDYGAILEKRGYQSAVGGLDPERRLVRMLMRGMLEHGFIDEHLQWARHSGLRVQLDTAGLTPLLPHRPGKIICLVRNWAEHARERRKKPPERPVYFAKTENSAIGPGEPIPLPEGVGRVDHEGELGVVMGRKARGVTPSDAGGYILGYTVVNDVTARELQRSLAEEGYPWFAAKSLDGFAPTGPWIVTRDQAEPLAGKRIRVTVNGELRQDGALEDMIFGVEQIIEAVSRDVTLKPGDIIATGTPSGVGPLKSGDEVAVEIDGIGRLINPVG